MKVTTLLSLTGGLAVGYVFGTAAGRPRYEQLSQGAHDLLQHPQVQQTVFDLAGTAKANAHRLPGPGAGVADRAATRVQDSLTRPDDLAEAPAPVAPAVAL
ncbi:MAG TPA: hypothetical protein VF635_09275 [Propionibacteriaceae bacterium]